VRCACVVIEYQNVNMFCYIFFIYASLTFFEFVALKYKNQEYFFLGVGKDMKCS